MGTTANRIVLYLRSLIDVLISSPADGDVLTYDATSGKWKNLAASGGGGSGIGGSTGTADNSILRADGTGGNTVQGSGVTINDAGGLEFPDYTIALRSGTSSAVRVWPDRVEVQGVAFSGAPGAAPSDVALLRAGSSVLKLVDPTSGTGAVLQIEAISSLGTPASGTIRIGNIAGEANVCDSSGNVTVISPHAKDAPADLYRIAPGVDKMARSANPFRGVVQFVNAEGIERWETFEEYNARNPESPLALEDWDQVEAERVAKRDGEISEWQERRDESLAAYAAWDSRDKEAHPNLPEPPSFTDPQPAPYAAQSRPDWARPVTRAELDAVVPASVMAHQLRVQLLVEGVDPDSVTAAVAAIPNAQTRKIAAAQWEYAPTIRRDHPLVGALAASLSLSADQVDEIFRKASKL